MRQELCKFMLDFGVFWITFVFISQRGIKHKQDLRTIPDLIHFAVKLPDPLINDTITNCLILSFIKKERSKTSRLVSILDNRSQTLSIFGSYTQV